MAWNTPVSAGDLITSEQFNSRTDFMNALSSNRSWATISGATDLTWNTSIFDGSGIKWDDGTQKWVAVNVVAAGGGINNVVEDTSPQLGGDLDGQSAYGIYDVTYISSTAYSGAKFGGELLGTGDTQAASGSHTHTQYDSLGEISWTIPTEGLGITLDGTTGMVSGALTIKVDGYIASSTAISKFAPSSKVSGWDAITASGTKYSLVYTWYSESSSKISAYVVSGDKYSTAYSERGSQISGDGLFWDGSNLDVGGYSIISSNAKIGADSVASGNEYTWAYDWINQSGSQLSDFLASGDEYSTSYSERGSQIAGLGLTWDGSELDIDDYIASATALANFAGSSNYSTHKGDSTIHFTEASISHDSIADVSADDHHAGFIGLEDDSTTTITPAADDRIEVSGQGGIYTKAGTSRIYISASSILRQAGGGGGGAENWDYISDGTGITGLGSNQYRVSGTAGDTTIGILGYSTISSQAKSGYDWYSASSSRISEYVASGEEYTSAYLSGQRVKDLFDHKLYIASSAAKGIYHPSGLVISGQQYSQAYASANALRDLAFKSTYSITGASDITWVSADWDNSGIRWDNVTQKWIAMPSSAGSDSSTILTIATASGVASTVTVRHDGTAGTLYLKDIPQDIIKSGSEYWSAYLSGQLSLQAISDGVSGWTSTAFTNSGLIWNGSNWLAWKSGGAGLSNIVEDTTPQLGGELDCNSNGINGATFVSSNGIINGNNFIGIASSMTLGLPEDGSFTGGTLSWTSTTKLTTALDDVNEILSELAPADADSLSGKTLIDNITLHSGRLASGAGITYESGAGPSSSVTYITDDSSIILDAGTPGITFNKADEGTLHCYINSVESGAIYLSTRFSEAERDGSQTYPPITSGSVTILSVGKYNDFQKWQVGSGQIDITTAIQFRKGWNEVYMSHEGLTTSVSSNIYECWYDTDAQTSASFIGTPSFTENTKKSKYLSGVEHYYLNSTFDVTCSSQHCFKNAFRTDRTIFTVDEDTGSNRFGLASTTFTPDHSSVTKVNPNSYPVTGETVGVYNHTVTITDANVYSTNGRMAFTVYNAYDSTTTDVRGGSNNTSCLIDTHESGSSGDSTPVYEYFDDEWWRAPSGNYASIPTTAMSGSWVKSSSALALGSCSAQVYNGRLYYPSVDFSTGYLPAGPDYSSGFNDVVYYRVFKDGGTPHTNGVLSLGNLSNSDVDAVGTGDVNVEIKLPTQTGWLDLGTGYDSGTFTGIDGDGCKTAQSSDDWSWTSGVFSTANSGYLIVVRITIRSGGSKPSITFIDSGW